MTSLLALLLLSGAAPLEGVCEASAAVVLKDGRLLVADNEQHKRLYLFRLNKKRTLDPVGTLNLPSQGRPRDIEALAREGSSLAVVGSHSTKKKCKPSRKRSRLRAVELDPGGDLKPLHLTEGADVLDAATRSLPSCVHNLFASPAPKGARAFCRAMLSQSCASIDVEGALIDQGGSLWLGLRRPLVEDRAVLVRVEAGETLRFDALLTVDLGGRGVRELVTTLDPQRSYLIGGPAADTDEAHALYWFDPRPLTKAADIQAVHLGPLPPSSEAYLPLSKTSGIALTDGDGDETPCKTPSLQVPVSFAPQKGSTGARPKQSPAPVVVPDGK